MSTPPEVKGEGMPTDFNGWSALVVRWLSFVEEISPFKVGQIQQLIANASKDSLPELGNQIAPYFAVAQIIFLLMFVAYFTLGVVALIHDHEAMDCECAEDSWIWLYALLVVVIPTSLGVVIGFIKGAMAAADLDEKLGFDTSIFTTLPGPALFLTLGILGIVLWANMTQACDEYYSSNNGLLLGIFHIQVVIMSIAAFFALLNVWAMSMVLIKKIWPGADEDAQNTKVN
jgi:hypothetical protein